uniref:ABC-type branched-chain amino acid transport system, permease component n=1 Tax=Candidatus Actinomarina minuta TaxID=1389454 RepID=S5DYK3_9ACTN|nr:ABC-type branched-chain amino acid transport system, permease component [Candidatus Actinomarina minuta]
MNSLLVSRRVIFTIAITSFSIYLVFILNPEGALRILINLLTFAGIYGLSAIGLNVHFGWTGLLNFGHASFMGMGAYVTLLLMPHAAGREGEVTTSGLPIIIAVFFGIAAAALFGLLLGLPAIRLRGDYLAIVTIAAAEIFRLLVRDLESITGGVYGIISYTENLQKFRPEFINSLSLNYEFAPSQAWVGIIAWVSIVLTLFLLKRLNSSPWGRALRAVREDEDAVRAMGKNAVWLKLQSFMLGAGIAGLSGVLLAFNYGSLETTVFVPLLTFYVWAIMILGGVGSLTGPIYGSIIFWVIISETDRLAYIFFENANGQQLAGFRFLLVGLLIMLLMIFRPSGLLGKKEELLLDVK